MGELNWMLDRKAADFDLPVRVEDSSAVPGQLMRLYEDGEDGSCVLTSGGHQLRRARLALRENYGRLVPAKAGKEPVVRADDWRQTLAVATPKERQILLAAAARGEVRIKS